MTFLSSKPVMRRLVICRYCEATHSIICEKGSVHPVLVDSLSDGFILGDEREHSEDNYRCIMCGHDSTVADVVFKIEEVQVDEDDEA